MAGESNRRAMLRVASTALGAARAASVLLGVCAAAAGCGTSSRAPDAATVDAGVCVSRSKIYSRTEKFSLDLDPLPATRPSCVPTCGQEEEGVNGFPGWAALPAGDCNNGTPSCDMGASEPCPCASDSGAVHEFRCSCKGSQWSCVIISQGAGACLPVSLSECADEDAGSGGA